MTISQSHRVARRRTHGPRRAVHVAGVGLIEVLVAVLVLSIGLLGVAALQATALRNSQSSLERSQGVIHAQSIFDMMRANAVEARAGGYVMPMTCAAPPGGSVSANDKQTWIQSMQQDLGPEACGQIACAPPLCTVTVRWNDSRAGGAAASAQQFSMVSRI
jgi:type IV pilus assembly protein PilV